MFKMLKAFGRWISNILSRKTRRVNEAADGVYTGSASGISDAFDDAQDALIKNYKQLEGAVAQVLSGVEQQRMQLEDLNNREADLIKKRDGALALAQRQPQNKAKHKAAFERYHSEIKKIEEEQEQLKAFIEGQEKQLEGLKVQLENMQRELKQLPAEKAKQIATYVSSQKIIEAYNRINGLETSYDRGPLDAVLKQNRELSALANVKRTMAGVDASQEDDMYANAGIESDASSAFDAMLAQRQADTADTTGADASVAEAAEGDDGDRSEF